MSAVRTGVRAYMDATLLTTSFTLLIGAKNKGCVRYITVKVHFGEAKKRELSPEKIRILDMDTSSSFRRSRPCGETKTLLGARANFEPPIFERKSLQLFFLEFGQKKHILMYARHVSSIIRLKI